MTSAVENAAGPGNLRRVSHGAYSSRLVTEASVPMLAAVEEMCGDLPAGQPAFAAQRAILAHKIARLCMVADHLEQDGFFNARGNPRPAASLELKLLQSVEKTLNDLGLTPTAAARLGVDLARSHSLADELEAAREARLRAEARHGSA